MTNLDADALAELPPSAAALMSGLNDLAVGTGEQLRPLIASDETLTQVVDLLSGFVVQVGTLVVTAVAEVEVELSAK